MSAECAIFVLRESALPIAERVAVALSAQIVRAWESDVRPIDLFRRRFGHFKAWVVLGSTGIAVRFLDGAIEDKHTDPAVVVLDEGGHHAISLLSGHEGGANDLAFAVANAVGASPVVSTATEALKPLVVGIGCRKDITANAIEIAVKQALSDRQIGEIRCVATIDLKAQEPGLLEFCRTHKLPLRVINREDVTDRSWVTKPSDWVQETVGIAGVCEPCALAATSRGRLIVPKTTCDGVAVAVVEDRWDLA